MKTSGEWYLVMRDLEVALNKLFRLGQSDFYEYDSLLQLDDLQSLKYVRNFPHLTCLMCDVDEHDRSDFASGEKNLTSDYNPKNTSVGLLPATCYKVYLDLKDQSLESQKMIGCIAKCFRNEDKSLDEYRGLNFTMKEFVFLGAADDARKHLEFGRTAIENLMQVLDIPVTYEKATDPFFDMSSPVAALSSAIPTKQEVTYDGHAVSSLNYHRNYFGENFNISYEGAPVHTSCVAFGMERWVSMFKNRIGDPGTTRERLSSFF